MFEFPFWLDTSESDWATLRCIRWESRASGRATTATQFHRWRSGWLVVWWSLRTETADAKCRIETCEWTCPRLTTRTYEDHLARWTCSTSSKTFALRCTPACASVHVSTGSKSLWSLWIVRNYDVCAPQWSYAMDVEESERDLTNESTMNRRRSVLERFLNESHVNNSSSLLCRPNVCWANLNKSQFWLLN